jgi:hypothetical protein
MFAIITERAQPPMVGADSPDMVPIAICGHAIAPMGSRPLAPSTLRLPHDRNVSNDIALLAGHVTAGKCFEKLIGLRIWTMTSPMDFVVI